MSGSEYANYYFSLRSLSHHKGQGARRGTTANFRRRLINQLKVAVPSARKFEEQMRAKQGKPIDIIPTSTTNLSTPSSKRPAASANVSIASSSKLDGGGGGGGAGGGGGGAGGVVAVVGGQTRQAEQLPDDDDFDEDNLNAIASKGFVRRGGCY